MNRLVLQPRFARPIPQVEEPLKLDSSSSSSEVIDMDYIIREKPDVKVVREYFRELVLGIEDD
jgi:hypothetical protein